MVVRVPLVYIVFAVSALASASLSHSQLTNGTVTAIPDGQGRVSLQWTGFSDLPLNVQRSTSLPRGEWTTLSFSNLTGTHVDLNPPAEKAFYRLVLPTTIHVTPDSVRGNWLIMGDASMNSDLIQLSISNTGPAVLTVTGIEGGDVFNYSFYFQNVPFTVQPAETKVVNVRVQTYYSFTGINESFVIRSSATSGSGEVRVEGSTYLDPSAGLY